MRTRHWPNQLGTLARKKRENATRLEIQLQNATLEALSVEDLITRITWLRQAIKDAIAEGYRVEQHDDPEHGVTRWVFIKSTREEGLK